MLYLDPVRDREYAVTVGAFAPNDLEEMHTLLTGSLGLAEAAAYAPGDIL
jgi:hypothetical protein